MNGETATVLSGTLTIGREPGESVGEYLITPSGLDSGNYKLIFNTGTLTVTRAPLTITAVAKTKLYGASDPPLTFTPSGLQFGDTEQTVLAGALTRAAGEGVAGSPYAITQGTLTANGNYTINFIDSTLTISKVPLSVVADAKTKVYGAADPTFTVTYGGFINGETSVVMGGTLILERAPGESAGTYLITPSGPTSGNYAINFTSNTLTITPRDLIVAASSKTKTYGAALTLNGTADFTTAGLQNGETIGSVTLTASGSPPGTAATAAAGSYTISPSEATGGTINPANYSLTYATSALTVNPASSLGYCRCQD